MGASATATDGDGLGATCAAQWAASVERYEEGSAGDISAVLFSTSGGDAPANNTVPGSTRVSLGLPRLKAGSYHAQFLDLTDATGTWRFRVGDFVTRVVPGAAPEDLQRDGGTVEAGQAEGGSVQGFEIGLRNLTTEPVEVTGASTDIPGLPVTWVLVDGDPARIVERMSIPTGTSVTVTIGTEATARRVSFVLATPEIRYRVGNAPERTALFDPIEFQSGVLDAGPAAAYAARLPSDSCAQKP